MFANSHYSPKCKLAQLTSSPKFQIRPICECRDTDKWCIPYMILYYFYTKMKLLDGSRVVPDVILALSCEDIMGIYSWSLFLSLFSFFFFLFCFCQSYHFFFHVGTKMIFSDGSIWSPLLLAFLC